MDLLENVVSKVANTVTAAEKTGINVRWIDKVLDEINSRRGHFVLLREARLLKIRLEELQKEIDKVG